MALKGVELRCCSQVMEQPADRAGGVWYLLKGAGYSAMSCLLSACAPMRVEHRTSWVLLSC